MQTSHERVPDLAAQLAAFNEFRRDLLRGRPIDPEGVEELMPDPPAMEAE